MNEAAGKNVNVGIPASASSEVQSDPILKTLLDAKKPSDFKMIIDYSHSYISTTTKLGYEPWIMYSEVLRIREEMERDLLFKSRYTNSSLNKDLYRLLRKKAELYSDSLDYIASSVSSREITVAMLCSLDWLFKIPDTTRKLMEAILQAGLSLKSINLFNLWTTFDPINMAWYLLHDILLLIMEAEKSLICWFLRDPDIWAIIYECKYVAEIVDSIITTIEDMEKWCFAQFEEALEQMVANRERSKFKATIALELKKIRMTIKKMEEIQRLGKELNQNFQDAYGVVTDSGQVLGRYAKGLGLALKDKAKGKGLSAEAERAVGSATRPFREFNKKNFEDSRWLAKQDFEEILEDPIPDPHPFVDPRCGLEDRTSTEPNVSLGFPEF